VAKLLVSLASAYGDAGLWDSKKQVLERALVTFRKHKGEDDGNVLFIKQQLAELAKRKASPDAALPPQHRIAAAVLTQDQTSLAEIASALAERWKRLPDDRKEALWRVEANRERELLDQELERLREQVKQLTQAQRDTELRHAQEKEQLQSAAAEQMAAAQAKLDRALRDAESTRRSSIVQAREEEADKQHARLQLVEEKNAALIAAAEEHAARHKRELGELRKTMTQLEQDKRVMQAEIDTLNRQLQALDVADGKSLSAQELGQEAERMVSRTKLLTQNLLAMLDRDRDGNARLLKEMEEKAEALRAEIAALNDSAARLQQKVTEIQKKMEEKALTEKQVKQMHGMLQLAESELAKVEAQLEQKEQELRVQTAKMEVLRQQMEQREQLSNTHLAQLAAQMEELESRYLELQAQYAELLKERAAQETRSNVLALTDTQGRRVVEAVEAEAQTDLTFRADIPHHQELTKSFSLRSLPNVNESAIKKSGGAAAGNGSGGGGGGGAAGSGKAAAAAASRGGISRQNSSESLGSRGSK
jgi:DNA repair exonuclease SbcCD ATPase subunit